MVDSRPAKTSSGGARATPESILAGLPVALTDLPRDVVDRLRTRAHRPDPRMTIGRYLILGEVGRGGMGLVYEAWDPDVERRVAVKTVEPDLIPDLQEREEVVERFMREIDIVEKLHHPGIVTIYDWGQEPKLAPHEDPHAPGRTWFYVMEFLDGQSLSRMMRQHGTLSDTRAVGISIDIADALDVAHAEKVVHRDIKPSNIFIRENGQAVLLDFGIAKTSSPALTRQGQILGTPSYLAPERLKEKEVPVDGRADLFSLGVLLYTMLVGEAPFVGDNVYDLIDNISKKAHRRLERSSEGGVLLSQVLDKLLAKEREDRYATAARTASSLREVQNLLLASSPDIADLGAHLAPVKEAMVDAATELASPGVPGVVPAGVLREGTRPELSLHRRTRQIDIKAAKDEMDYEASYPSPKVYDPEDLRALEDDAEQAERESTQIAAPPTERPSKPSVHPSVKPVDPFGDNAQPTLMDESVEPEPSTDSTPTRSPDPGPSAIPIRRFSSVSEDETIAEPGGLEDLRPPPLRKGATPRVERGKGRFEARTVADREIRVTGARTGAPRRRGAIEARDVDEQDVIVRPAPLDPLKEDDIPTHSGPAPVAKPYDPIETDIVRPRKITPEDPAERRDEDDPNDPEDVLRERDDRDERGERPTSAAVARRTFGVRKQSSLVRPPKERLHSVREPTGSADIHVSGDLDDLDDHNQVVRNRVVILVAAALFAVAIGLLLGRMKQRKAVEISGNDAPPTPVLTARPAEPKAPELVVPRTASQILSDAQSALTSAGNDKSKLAAVDQQFLKAVQASKPGSDAHIDALLGRARTLTRAGARSSAHKVYEQILRLRKNGAAAREARGALGRNDPAPKVRKPAPRTVKKKLVKSSGQSVTAQCNAIFLKNVKTPKRGITAMKKLASAHPSSACPHKKLGVLFNRVGKPRSALKSYRKYLQLRPRAPDREAVKRHIASLSKKLGS